MIGEGLRRRHRHGVSGRSGLLDLHFEQRASARQVGGDPRAIRPTGEHVAQAVIGVLGRLHGSPDRPPGDLRRGRVSFPLAGTLGIPADLDAAAARALTGGVRRLDLVRVEKTVCIGYAGVGFDSEVTRFANEEVKRLRGPLVYVYAVLHTLATFKPPAMRVVHGPARRQGRQDLTSSTRRRELHPSAISLA